MNVSDFVFSSVSFCVLIAAKLIEQMLRKGERAVIGVITPVGWHFVCLNVTDISLAGCMIHLHE